MCLGLLSIDRGFTGRFQTFPELIPRTRIGAVSRTNRGRLRDPEDHPAVCVWAKHNYGGVILLSLRLHCFLSCNGGEADRRVRQAIMVWSNLRNKARRRSRELGGHAHGDSGHRTIPPSRARTRLVSPESSPGLSSRIEKAWRKLGEKVRNLRQQRGFSRSQLGKACGITALEMKKIENGEIDASLFTMIRLAGALSIKLHSLLRGIK